MYQHLILPLDGSRLAETALPTAVALARKLRARMTLVHVIERNAPSQVHGEPHLVLPGEAQSYLEEIRRRFFESPDDAGAWRIPVEIHVHTEGVENVARAIVEHALEFGSDLVVMCTHGRGGLKQWLFGSIALRVAGERLPVLLVQPQADGGAPRLTTGGPFLVPLDGSEVREAALPVAAALARACGAALRLLMVVPTTGTLSGAAGASQILLPATTKEMLSFVEEDADFYLEKLADRLHAETGVEVGRAVRRGESAHAIAQEMEHARADWLIMGTSARTGMEAFWGGSVAPKVSGAIARPLLLIPQAARD